MNTKELIKPVESRSNRMMSRAPGKTLSFLVLSGMISIGANSQELNWTIEAGAGYSDNINRGAETLTDPNLDELIYSLGSSLTWEKSTGKFDAMVDGSVTLLNYDKGTYSDEVLGGANVAFLYKIDPDRLAWFLVDNYGQQAIDPLRAITPENRENINYLTTGPQVIIPLADRLSLGFVGEVSDITYEERPLDNDRLGGRIYIQRDLSTTQSIAIFAFSERTEFDEAESFQPYEQNNLYLRFESETARSELVVDLGMSRIEQGGYEDDGLVASVDWLRRISQRTDLTIDAGTRITDDAGSFRFGQNVLGDLGVTQSQFAVGSPFREDYAIVGLESERSRNTFGVSLRWQDQNYLELDNFDRKLLAIRARLERRIANRFRGRLEYEYLRSAWQFEDNTYKDHVFGAELSWQVGPRLEVLLRAERFDRDAGSMVSEYTENRGFLGVRYLPLEDN